MSNKLLEKILDWLKDPRLNHCVYMENGEFYTDKDALVKEIEEHLRKRK
jgi:hypothetical protein